MKRSLLLVCVTLFCLLFAGAVRADEYDAYLSPWESASISEEVREAGNLQFFFMAGEGLKMVDTSDDLEKWGDSCLVVFPTGELMLIDAGMPDYVPVLIRNLERLGVTRLDYLMISHPHDDHAGGVYTPGGIPEHFEIGKAFYNGAYNAHWSDPHRLESVLAAHNVPLETVSEGWTLDIGEVRLRAISPSAETAGQYFTTTDDINNSSIVLRMDYRDFSALFTGDIYKLKEAELVREKPELLDVDLLKMPHHGNGTSNSKGFAAAVTPKLAVATGRLVIQDFNYYVYTMTGSRVLFDFCDGYIHVSTDGKDMEWDHSRERTIDYYDKYEYEALMEKKNKK